MTAPAARVVALLASRGWSIAVAESLTGGLVTDALVSVPGASLVVRGGLTAYQVPVKTGVLGVDPDLIERDGVVSPAVALAMARGARGMFAAEVGVGTTGVAGPGPSDGMAPGTIVVAASVRSAGRVRERHAVRAWRLGGPRGAVRAAAAELGVVLAATLLEPGGWDER